MLSCFPSGLSPVYFALYGRHVSTSHTLIRQNLRSPMRLQLSEQVGPTAPSGGIPAGHVSRGETGGSNQRETGRRLPCSMSTVKSGCRSTLRLWISSDASFGGTVTGTSFLDSKSGPALFLQLIRMFVHLLGVFWVFLFFPLLGELSECYFYLVIAVGKD